MDDNQFFQSLKSDDDQRAEYMAGAEHLVRLRHQTGYAQRALENQFSDLEKTASLHSRVTDFISNSPRLIRFSGNHPRVFSAGIGASMGATETLESLSRIFTRDNLDRLFDVGVLAGQGAIGYGAYRLGKNQGKKEKQAGFSQFMDGLVAGSPHLNLVDGTAGAIKGPNRSFNGGKATGALIGLAGPMALGALLQKKKDKQASVLGAIKQTGKGVVDRVNNMDPVVKYLMAGTGAVMGLGTYLGSRPQQELGGKSKLEVSAERDLANNKNTPEKTLGDKMHARNSELAAGYAKAFREHPVRAALLTVPFGMATGYGIARAGGAGVRAGRAFANAVRNTP